MSDRPEPIAEIARRVAEARRRESDERRETLCLAREWAAMIEPPWLADATAHLRPEHTAGRELPQRREGM